MAGASKSLTYNIFGHDKSATRAMRGVAKSAESLNKGFKRLGGAIVGAFAVRSVINFGKEAVEAFSDAETQQRKLEDALERYPKLQGANLKALQDWNKELQRGSRFDDDAIAGAEANLAQYGLTEKQLRRLTPLLLDYAARTGKDVLSASQDLGKSLLGQGRALKNVGINFKDTGTLGGNFEQLIDGLSAKVGGFAEKDLTTTAGKLENLKNRFGDMQEQIGGALVDAISELADEFGEDLLGAAQDFTDWATGDGLKGVKDFIGFLVDNKDELPKWAGGIASLTAAVWLLNIAMDANPIGVIIAGLGLIATGVVYLTQVNKEAGQSFQDFFYGIMGGIADILVGITNGVDGFVNGIIDGLNALLVPLNGIIGFFGGAKIELAHVNLSATAQQFKGAVGVLGSATRVYFGNGRATVNGSGSQTPLSFLDVGKMQKMAEGGIVRHRPGGIFANIGEGRYDEAVIPLKPGEGIGGRPIEVKQYITATDPWIAAEAGAQRLRTALRSTR